MVVVGAYRESDMRQPGLVLYGGKGVFEAHIRRGAGKGVRRGWEGQKGRCGTGGEDEQGGGGVRHPEV